MDKKDILTTEQIRSFTKERLFELERDTRVELVKLSMGSLSDTKKKSSGKRRYLRKTIARLLTVKAEQEKNKVA